MSRRTIIACRAALLLGFVAGCGGGDGGVAVSGAVSHEGTPLDEGTIQFIPTGKGDGRAAGGAIVAGRYSIPRKGGPFPGTYRVEISAYREARPQTEEELGGALFGRPASEMGLSETELMVRENYIPDRYNTETTLSATIPDQGSYEQDFELR